MSNKTKPSDEKKLENFIELLAENIESKKIDIDTLDEIITCIKNIND